MIRTKPCTSLLRVFPSVQWVQQQQRSTSSDQQRSTDRSTTVDSAATSISSKKDPNLLQVLEIPVSTLKDVQNSSVLYTRHHQPNDDNVAHGGTNSTVAPPPSGTTRWTSQPVTTQKCVTGGGSTTTILDQPLSIQQFSRNTVSLFLPAQFPKSVAPGYIGFASLCFSASIAGSAAMVLSTQTLLLAVGIVGQNVHEASIMAGAFNWVMKDFVGQLGGVVFASQMGKTRAFDTDPKRWRMVAAMALDGATLLEIVSPLFPSALVLPVASVANIGKNIGFLTASASRAALHQAVAISGNLGDVTAKAGSQSIMASLIGTTLGIGLSSLLGHDTYNFAIGFLGLTTIHQGCNYLSLRYIPLAHFNRQRLLLVLDTYLVTSASTKPENGIITAEVLNPTEIASLERFFPLVPNMESSSKEWLRIGASLVDVCPNPTQLEHLLALTPGASYLICVRDDHHNNIGNNNQQKGIDLVYFEGGTGVDVIRGMYHACLLRQALASTTTTTTTTTTSVNTSSEDDQQIRRTHEIAVQNFPHLLEQLHTAGWKTDSDVTTVECSTAYRLHII
jgi:hypothetical protein